MQDLTLQALEGQCIDSKALALLSRVFGEACLYQRLGRGRSLALGFGQKKVFPGMPRLGYDYYGEWEIGSYYAAWRVTQNGKVLCGSQEVVDSLEELATRLNSIKLGNVLSINMLSSFDIRLSFDNDMNVDFLWTSSDDDDEVVYMFCPNDMFIAYFSTHGWKVGKSTEPFVTE